MYAARLEKQPPRIQKNASLQVRRVCGVAGGTGARGRVAFLPTGSLVGALFVPAAHVLFENDEPADMVVDKHTRFLKKHFTPAYDGILEDNVREGVEFLLVASGEFHGRRFCMRTCASPRKIYRVWARGNCTDWMWRQFNLTRDQVAPFHAPFVTGNAVPPSVVKLKKGGSSMLVVMKDYNRMSSVQLPLPSAAGDVDTTWHSARGDSRRGERGVGTQEGCGVGGVGDRVRVLVRSATGLRASHSAVG